MALLHKTQKQLLPSILFFFNTECNFGKKRAVFESGNLVDKTKHFFFTNSIIQTKPAWKKRNFFVWQKTLHLTKPLLFDGKTLHLTKSFFFRLEEFYYDFCFFTKIIFLKRKAFSHRYATSRWQTSEKEKIFGEKKKLIHVEVQRGNLFWTLVILLIKHEKLLDNGTLHIFPFRVGCT